MIPCICGHERSNHFEIGFKYKASIFACRDINDCHCHDYEPIPNLEYLEKLYEAKRTK